jgi:TatD DNase family protein
MTEQHNIIDIGVNLAHRSFHGDRGAVIQRAFEAGVRTMIITGTSLASSQEAQRIARDYPGRLFFTSGVHPHTHKTLESIDFIEQQVLSTLP